MVLRCMSDLEKIWIDKFLEASFPDKAIVQEQLSSVCVKSETLTPYISLGLQTQCQVAFPHKERVPVIMQAWQPNQVPIEFLLHFADGFVSELEIYYADGSEVDYNNIMLDNIEYEIRV